MFYQWRHEIYILLCLANFLCHVYMIHRWCLTWLAHPLWYMMSYYGSMPQMHLPIILDSNPSCSVWASTSTISVDIPMHVSWWTCVFISSGYIPLNGIFRTEGVHTPSLSLEGRQQEFWRGLCWWLWAPPVCGFSSRLIRTVLTVVWLLYSSSSRRCVVRTFTYKININARMCFCG